MAESVDGQDRAKAVRRRTAPRDERVRELIAAAMEVIAAKGLTGTTTAAVTARAGLSAGIVSLHFGSKEGLLVATLESLANEHRAKWVTAQGAAGVGAKERLWAVIAAHFHPDICTRTKIAVWFAFFGERRYRETYREIVAQLDLERTAVVEAACREIVAEGGYAAVDPALVALSIENLADGLWLDLLLYPGRVTLERARAQMQALLAVHFPLHFPQAEADGEYGT
jgi:TetR/AcrR family transcriptional regulator, transcriptional repressor of bet genes